MKEASVRRRHWAAIAAATVVGATATVVAARQTKPANGPPSDSERERNLRTYTELMRSDIRSQKVAIITEMMLLSEAEDVKFWPIYREYELELSRLNDERIQLIDTYGATYTNLTDPQADDLALKALGLESRRTALKQKYYEKLKAALSPRLATKALHVEHQIELLVDLQIAAALPVTPPR
jgi:hypothetical protein